MYVMPQTVAKNRLHFLLPTLLVVVVCQLGVRLESAFGCNGGPCLNPTNNHTYITLSPANWTDSEAQAEAMGGHLATIRNLQENNWIYSNFSAMYGSGTYVGNGLWTGLNYDVSASQWVWASGEPVNYTNWAPGEPSGPSSTDRYVNLLWPGDPRQSQWNDISNVSSFVGIPLVGVVEIIPRTWTGGDGSWSEATKWDSLAVPADGMVTIAGTDGVSRTVTYDYAGPPVTLYSLTLDSVQGTGPATTTLLMNANNLTPKTEFIGYNGTGSFIQSGGTNSPTNLIVGDNSGSTGVYTLNGTGSLSVGSFELVGAFGAGTFNQSDGINNAGALAVGINGVGTFALSGGSLITSGEAVGGHIINGNWGGSGSLIQTGGTNTTKSLRLGNGPNATGTYIISGGSASVVNVFLGNAGGGVGKLEVDGSGALNVTGAITIYAMYTANRNSLTLNGGTTNVGNIGNQDLFTINGGTLTVGDVTLFSTSALGIGLGGTIRPNYGALTSNGHVTLDGSLTVSPEGGFNPEIGDSFDILDWGTLTGTFAAIHLPSLGTGAMWNMSLLYTEGILRVTIAGDFNGDGVDNAADYVAWRDTLGSITNLSADGNGNGIVDPGDFNVWRSHFGQSISGRGSAFQAAVPEPSQLILAAIASFPVLWISSRRRSLTTRKRT